MYLKLRWAYSQSLYQNDGASRDDLAEAVAVLGEVSSTTRRVYGTSHPTTKDIQNHLKNAQNMIVWFDSRACLRI